MKKVKAKPSKAKRKSAPKRTAKRPASTPSLKVQLAHLARERDEALAHLAEALEQQTATSEVLKVISSSPGQLEPMFRTILGKAIELCEAHYGTLWLCEGDAFGGCWPTHFNSGSYGHKKEVGSLFRCAPT